LVPENPNQSTTTRGTYVDVVEKENAFEVTAGTVY